MTSTKKLTMPTPDGFIAFAGIELRSILSAELFREAAGASGNLSGISIAQLCHDRWTDLASTLAALPTHIELFAITGGAAEQSEQVDDAAITFLVAGRGADKREAESNCQSSHDNLWQLLTTILDYAELVFITEERRLERAIAYLRLPHVVEVRRRIEYLRASHGYIERQTIGFRAAAQHAEDESCADDEQANLSGKPTAERTHDDDNANDNCITVEQLFPWIPSDDSWRRLLETLTATQPTAALVVHLRNVEKPSPACLNRARAAMAQAEKIVARNIAQELETVLGLQTEVLRHEALRRLAILEGRLLAARVFVTSNQPAPAALVATVVDCLDDASTNAAQAGVEAMFRGGARLVPVTTDDICAPLCNSDSDEFELLFSPRETSGILRTPMPVDAELPGLRINRARTARMIGHSGTDAPLGWNVHRGVRDLVRLDEGVRFRHTYIIGQTGTGKSTLLLNMILHDIGRGRGVGVLDPHGSLIDSILEHYPKERAEDLVIVDVTDIERPVGFNPLCIAEQDALQYRIARDLVIDDLLSYFHRSYDRDMLGPFFETHFRGMMSLLLGVSPQTPERVPNLLLFRSLYMNKGLRQRLIVQLAGRDVMIEDFIKEVTSAVGETSLQNTSTYVTSKFNRFVSDLSLRNITCQSRTLDFDDIVSTGKVLLFYLGKGRFGDQAAGLLASQIVSRLRQSVMKRGASRDIRPFFLYADEFQLFADERFAELLAEARKFKLSLTLAHQYVQQLPPQVLQGVLGNVGTTISFRVGAPDGEMLEEAFAPTFTARDLTSLQNFRAYVRSIGALGLTPFSIEMDAPPGGGDENAATALRQLARLKYGRDRQHVENEISATFARYNSSGDATAG